MTGDVISCGRFELRLMSPSCIEALLAHDDVAAERELGASFPVPAWARDDGYVLRMRLEQIRADPACAPWLLRAIVAADGTMIGHAGFHGPPDERRSVELGYTVFEPFRRQGYAAEAARCLMRWAEQVQGVRLFRVSVGEANEPSLALAAKLGFVRVGEQIDEIDGLEYVFEREGVPT